MFYYNITRDKLYYTRLNKRMFLLNKRIFITCKFLAAAYKRDFTVCLVVPNFTLFVLFSPSLKSLDLVTMKALDSKVNIVPVIAKADTITKNELHKFKLKVSDRTFQGTHCTGKTGKVGGGILVRENTGNLEILPKHRENIGNWVCLSCKFPDMLKLDKSAKSVLCL